MESQKFEEMGGVTESVNGESLGTVKWFSRMKGWGFIEPDGGDRDVFVHYEDIIGEGFRNLEKGDRVKFHIEDTSKGPKATMVTSLGARVAIE